MKYLLEVQAPGMQAEQHELEQGLVTAGQGDGAELRIAAPAFQARHIALEVLPEGVRVHLLAGIEGAIIFDGEQLREAVVPWGGEVFISGVRLSFLAPGERKRKAHPLLVVALAVGLVGLGWQGGGAAADASAAAPVEAPALTLPPTPCPETDAGAAAERAAKEERAAEAKLERYPFDAGEGLRALARLQLAKACFSVAGAAAELARAEEQQLALQRTLSEDLAAWRLRLDRALSQDRPRDALAAVKGLEALFAPLGDNAYRTWLSAQRNRLERKQAR
jgi:hypothetical protein